ncbi:MAG: PD40 domain-containing protein [Dehalococcoidales bacterium]|nr:PD40 domain-containing protein [Dehalococcoidales bacterium]
MLNRIKTATSLIVILSIIASSFYFPTETSSAKEAPEQEQNLNWNIEKGNSKLDSQLEPLIAAKDPEQFKVFAQQKSIDISEEQIRVVIERSKGDLEAIFHEVEAIGSIESTYENLLQVMVPVSQLSALADIPGVDFVRLPYKPLEDTISEGVVLSEADSWHSAGYAGAGVKMAIIDTGFAGSDTLQAQGELPASAILHWTPSIGGPGSSSHGTACAEIVYDMAPGAQLYLVNFSTEVELGVAVNWLIDEQVDIITHSIGWPISGPGDGTGPVCQVVDDARANGILWVNSVGNLPQRHWQGNFTDTNGDGIHEFASEDIGNTIFISGNLPVTIALKWDDPWGASANDYDLLLCESSGKIITYSANIQDGNDNPVEAFSTNFVNNGYYFIVIIKYGNPSPSNFHLYSFEHDLQYQTSTSSFSIPADSENALAIGAVPYTNPSTLESFSSRGPTKDGRIKPDLVAPDGVSTQSYGTSAFTGTSASASHVAGAAALIKELHPEYNPSYIQSYLEEGAIDLGNPGKDNLFGTGRICLQETLFDGLVIEQLGPAESECTSLALDEFNNPYIAYIDKDDDKIKCISWDGSDWQTEVVDDEFVNSEHPVLALDNSGQPHIAYTCHQDLQYTHRDVSGWHRQTLDTGISSNPDISLDGSGNLYITCSDQNFDLKYHHLDIHGWHMGFVDQSADYVGLFNSLALDSSGYPHVSYYDSEPQGDLKYARWDGVSWYIETVDSAGDVGQFTSLALDSSSEPHISYYDATNRDLKYAFRDNTIWKIQTVDSSGYVGEYSSLALDNTGCPHICYYDATNENLKYAVWKDNSWCIRSLDTAGDVGKYAALALGPNQDSHICYFDETNDTLKYFHQLATPPSMRILTDPEEQYFSSAPILSQVRFDAYTGLDDGWYQLDSYTGEWTNIFSDIQDTYFDIREWEIPGFGDLSEASHIIYFRASNDDGEITGGNGELKWQFYKDITPPSQPVDITSTSHIVEVLSADDTVEITWVDALDELSGLDGYSMLWDNSPDTLPDDILDIEESIQSTVSPELSGGSNHYFHIRSKDIAGNWQTDASHSGPYFIMNKPVMEPITEAQGQYYSSSPCLSNLAFYDEAGLDAGWYQMDSCTGEWADLFTDLAGDSWISQEWEIPGFEALEGGGHTIYFKASNDAGLTGGKNGKWKWQFYKKGGRTGKIVFDSDESGYYEIYSVDADGSNRKKLTDLQTESHQPVWSPNGRSIAFASEYGNNRYIFVMNFNGSGLKPITSSYFSDNPAWSPDGRKIAYASASFANNPAIYVIDADGSNPVRLTNNSFPEYNPVWSPDGTKIAFERYMDNNHTDIWVMNIDGTDMRNLTNDPADDREPAWSPDGTRIAFTSNRNSNHDIYLMDADGTNVKRLTSHPNMGKDPCWSPDGTMLAYSGHSSSGCSGILIMTADGSNPVQVTSNSYNDIHPDWISKEIFDVDINTLDATEVTGNSARLNGNLEDLGIEDKVEVSFEWGTGSNDYSNQTVAQEMSQPGDFHFDLSGLNRGTTYFYRANSVGINTCYGSESSFEIVSSDQAPLPMGKIVFSSERDGNSEIYIMNGDGSQQTRVTNSSVADIFPSWSPDGKKIAYMSGPGGNNDIYIMDADGSNVANLTEGSNSWHPSWSPDSCKIVFSSTENGDSQIYTMDSDGANKIQLTQSGVNIRPDWSVDGKILYVSNSASQNVIFIMDADGNNKTQITPDGSQAFYPKWSPDGTRIVYSSNRDGHDEIFMIDSDGSNETRLTSNSVYSVYPQWSSNGSQIVFTSARDGNPEIYTMDIDGSNVSRLTNQSEGDFHPDWTATAVSTLGVTDLDTYSVTLNGRLTSLGGSSSVNVSFEYGPTANYGSNTAARSISSIEDFSFDLTGLLPSQNYHFRAKADSGTAGIAYGDDMTFIPGKIVFTSERDGNPEIYVMNPDGSNQQRLSDFSGYDYQPAWSPDGSRIAFVSERSGPYNIYVMNADGSNPVRLTTADGDWCPRWSPDGSKIVFFSGRTDTSQIYVMNADGSNLIQLTNSGANHTPDWSSIGKILYLSDNGAENGLYSMNPDGTDKIKIDSGVNHHFDPRWSPDGTRILYTNSLYEIWEMNADGTGKTLIKGSTSSTPAWSRDGEKIAFASNFDGNWEICLIDSDGNSEVTLTDNTGSDHQPDWHPSCPEAQNQPDENGRRRGGGGGGGGSAEQVNFVSTSGFNSGASLRVDDTGTVLSSASLQVVGGEATLDITKDTKLVDAQGKALQTLSAIKMEPPPIPVPQQAIMSAYDFGPDGAMFDPPLILSLKYDPAGIPGGAESGKIKIAYWDGNTWIALESTIDPEANTVSAGISHFCPYGLLVELPTPAEFTISGISASPENVNPGDLVTVQAEVTNIGGSAGTHSLVLKINTVEVETKEITLEPGQTETVIFQLKSSPPGEYIIDVNGNKGMYIIKDMPQLPAPFLPEGTISALEPVISPDSPPVSEQPIPSTSAPEPEASSSSKAEENEFPLRWIIIGISLMILGMIIGILIARREKLFHGK